jgi:AcrR family transcriptional regulator
LVRDRKNPRIRRQEILEAAAELFGARGIDGVSIADIAERAGIAKGLLYHYFESKDALVTVLRERYSSEWYAEIERLLSDPSATDDAERYERFLRSMYVFHADKVEIHYLLLGSEGAEDEIVEKVRKLLLDFIRIGVKQKSFSVQRIEPTVDFLLNGLHGLLVKYLHEGRSAKRFTNDALSLTRPLLGY